MENIVCCSQHGKERVRERCGINKKSALRCAENAVSRGQHYMETKGSVRRWLDDQIRNTGHQIYVYGDKAFIFTSETLMLVTVLQMPAEIARCNNKNRRKNNRQTTGMSLA